MDTAAMYFPFAKIPKGCPPETRRSHADALRRGSMQRHLKPVDDGTEVLVTANVGIIAAPSHSRPAMYGSSLARAAGILFDCPAQGLGQVHHYLDMFFD
ncbi:MAG: hypothetical protein JJ913_06700 [Rhizobiaceae bacterium]|nr:hypothetical protein [Rhizobiaceae bacterium]